MNKQIKVFSNSNRANVEQEVNQFLASKYTYHHGETQIFVTETILSYTVTIVYIARPEPVDGDDLPF